MPVITAKRRGPCSVCRETIEPGERVLFDSVQGARHLTCSDQQPQPRTNEHRAQCAVCDRWLAAGKGALELHEEQLPDGTFKKTWLVHCLAGCTVQVRASPLLPDRRRFR